MPPTNDNLHQIMYTSTAAQHMDVADLSDLLMQARETNNRLDVTGMLLYRKKSFMQLIEGEHDTLVDLYETIQADERHRNVITLLDDHADDRDFEGWSMAFRYLGDLAPDDLPEGYSSFFDKGFEASDLQEDSSYGKSMLLYFRDAGEF
jgi:hypothetical protein